MDDKIGLVQRPPDIDVRRAVHLKLLPETHAGIRLLCTKRGISMQELFEEFAQLVLIDDPRAGPIVDNLVIRKRERYYRRLSRTDAESIFDIIELESPLK